MASGIFSNPNYTTALRLAPLITSSATVTFVGNQQWIFELFTRPELVAQGSKTFLPPWFSKAFCIGMPKVVGLVTFTAIGAVLNLHSSPRGAQRWYAAGAVLSAAHLLFVPALVGRAKGVVEDTEEEGRCLGEMKGWLRVNAVRASTVDVGAWICCLVAAVKSLRPV
ncbi:hypothetical protein QBC34DRAFT_213533 [Podospora aff. communis PSN243]|uniref:DUF1772 domain-containing protein n=1 Tax=Podospora aff. communis PSN243 TaxID=3040156 RepID=A0AAV9G6F4_9PEZI|nr:hypothetical protein QBC34DRAFT_213533 [Podospora aff. communis PSN243]